MVKSMTYAATVPQFFMNEEYDVTKLYQFREKINSKIKEKHDRISIFAFIIKAYSMALKDHPKLNSKYEPDEDPYSCKIMSAHNISIAIDSNHGLIAPNIKNVQDLSIREIHEEIYRLRDLSQQGKIGRNELFGGTIALSNIGSIAGTYAAPINLPG